MVMHHLTVSSQSLERKLKIRAKINYVSILFSCWAITRFLFYLFAMNCQFLVSSVLIVFCHLSQQYQWKWCQLQMFLNFKMRSSVRVLSLFGVG